MTDNPFIRFVRNHPLAVVIAVALLLRLVAVVYSRGYMASDDHFETIDIAYNWLLTGPLDSDGHLTWRHTPSHEIARFPLYTLFLYGIMKLHSLAGITSLDSMMYGIRFVHALLSLLSVWGMFQIAKLATGSDRWALVAGLVGAAHFAMPYLSVRNLIEVVGGHIWLVALLFVYLHYRDKRNSWLFWAGVITGVAWMIRFQVAMAALPVPLVLWWQTRSLKPALYYVMGVGLAVLIAGLVDSVLLGPFLGSFINNVEQAGREGALYNTSTFIYPLLLLALLIPPLSLLVTYLAARRRFWEEHFVLTATILSAILLHSFAANRQERFMAVILPEVLLYAVLTLEFHLRPGGLLTARRTLAKWLVVPAVALNLILLPVFTTTYSHKSAVEPLVLVGREDLPPDELGSPDVLFVSPEQVRMYPLAYAGPESVGRGFVNTWTDFRAARIYTADSIRYEFAILYPADSSNLARMVDSVNAYFGPMPVWKHIPPSTMDWLLHKLNPEHNKTNESWVLRRER